MVIETNLHMGKGIVRGDQFPIRRIVRKIPSGVQIQSATLTLKSIISEADPGLFQKTISSTNVFGTGQVEDVNTNGIGVLRFDLSSGDTTSMVADQEYFFDISVLFNNSTVLTLERGKTSAVEEVDITL